MDISQVIHDARTTQGISQGKLADRLECSVSTISRLEKGLIKWKFEDVIKVLEVLGLKINIERRIS